MQQSGMFYFNPPTPYHPYLIINLLYYNLTYSAYYNLNADSHDQRIM